MLYDADSCKAFRKMLIFKLKSLRDVFHKKIISDEKELKNLLEYCDEYGYCKNTSITAMYKMSREIERQLQYIENNDIKFEFGLKDYNKALKKIWNYVVDFSDTVSLVEGGILEELCQYKDFKNYVFQKCILGY